jgi:flagellar basal body-associated protein FliL
MRKKLTALIGITVVLAGLLAGCGGDTPPPQFEGANDTIFQLTDDFRINANTAGIPDGDSLGRYNFVFCEVTLEINDDSIIPILNDRIHRVREIIIFAVSDKPLNMIKSKDQIAALGAEIVEKINAEFNTTAVSRLVFSEYYFFRG